METWWIDNPHRVGSSNLTLADLEALRRDGFGGRVSLLDEQDQPPRDDVDRAMALGLVRHNIPVKDFHPPTVEQLERFVQLIAGLSPGAKTVGHCEGADRANGDLAAAYWRAKGLPVSDAIAHIRRARPYAVEAQEQEAALTAFATR